MAGVAVSVAPSGGAAPPLDVTIKAVRFVCHWKWDIPEDDVCGICRIEFERCCPSCKVAGDDCPPVWGACNHTFHMHCIMKWLEASKDKDPECPLDRRPWEFRSDDAAANAAALTIGVDGEGGSAGSGGGGAAGGAAAATAGAVGGDGDLGDREEGSAFDVGSSGGQGGTGDDGEFFDEPEWDGDGMGSLDS